MYRMEFLLKEDKNKMYLGEGTLLIAQSHSEPICSVPVVGESNESNCRAGHMGVIFLAGKAVICGSRYITGFKKWNSDGCRKKERESYTETD